MLAGLGGSFATMLVVYFVPIGTYLNFKRTSVKNPELASILKRSTLVKETSKSPSGPSSLAVSPKASVMEVSDKDQDVVANKTYVSESRRKKEFIASAIFGVFCCVCAVYVFVLQLKGIFASD